VDNWHRFYMGQMFFFVLEHVCKRAKATEVKAQLASVEGTRGAFVSCRWLAHLQSILLDTSHVFVL